MCPNRFYDVIRIGPVQVGTFNNGRGQTKHTAACTAPQPNRTRMNVPRPSASNIRREDGIEIL